MTEFLTAHPYLSFAFFFTAFLFTTLWYLIYTVGKKQPEEKPEEKQNLEDSLVNLPALNLDEAIARCNEFAKDHSGTQIEKNHLHMALLLGELKDRRRSEDLRQELQATEEDLLKEKKCA